MSFTIGIGGKKYILVPVDSLSGAPGASNEVSGIENGSILNLYTEEGGKNEEEKEAEPAKEDSQVFSGVKKAVGRLSEYRQRFKDRRLTLQDIAHRKRFLKELPRQDSELDNFTYHGEKLFFGEGIEEEG